MRQSCDIIMSEYSDAVPTRSRLRMPMSLPRVFQGEPRMLVSAQVIALSVLLGDPMRVRGNLV